MRERLRFLCLLVALCAVAVPAQAQPACKDQSLPKPDPALPYTVVVSSRLLTLEKDGCLGGVNDPNAKPVLGILKPSTDAEDREDPFKKSALSALARIGQDARSLHTSDDTAIYSAVALQVDAAAVALGTGLSPAVPAAWQLQGGSGRIAAIPISLPSALAGCVAADDERCAKQFEVAKQLLRIARLTESTLNYYARPELQKHRDEAVKRAKKWDDYFGVARSQYPWELALNGALMSDTRPEANGVRFGFRDVPTYQVILIHPYAAFEYADAEPEGTRFSGIVLVDVIGYNRWRWKTDGSTGFAIGGSVIVSMGDHANMDDIGWGAMLHLDHKWSFGVTINGDKRTFLVSGDVARLWTGASETVRARLRTAQ
jgi:hypothetical protein